MGWLEESSLVTLLVSWIHTDVDFKSRLSYTAGNVEPPCTGSMDITICPISKNKQLVDSQIDVNSTPSRGGRYVSPIRLYPACYNGDIQAINARSLDVHINLQYKKWKKAGKMVEDNYAHQTQ